MARFPSPTTYPVAVDRGYAWIVLASCFVMRMLAEGFWSSLGILFVKWETYFVVSASESAWMGSGFMLILFSAAPISSALAHRLTYRVVVISAGIIASLSCFVMSLVTSFWHLYVIVPFISFGLGLTFQASFTFFVYYFDKRFVLASMVNCAATGMGFLTLPPLMEILIGCYGWRGALQIASAIIANICVCGSLLRPPKLTQFDTKERKSEFRLTTGSTREDHRQQQNRLSFLKEIATVFDLSLFRSVRFILQAIVNGLLFGGGFCTTSIYLVPYAVEVGVSSSKSSLLMLAYGVCCVLMRVSPVGWVVDKKIVSSSTLGGVTLVLCGIDIIVMAFTKTFVGLIVAAVVLGLSVGIGGPQVMVVVTYSAGSKEKAPGAVAWMILQYGIGTLICMLLTGVLYDSTGSYQIPLIVCGLCIVSVGLILWTDPCLIRLQTKLDERRKGYSESIDEHANCSSLENYANKTQV